MPIAVRYVTTQPNQTATFDFSGHTVLSYTVGVAYWSFTFGDHDHHVKTLELSLAPNKPDNAHVTVKVTGKLQDDSGNTINTSKSSVVVCCVAVVDTKDSNVALASASGIPNNGQSSGIALPSSTLSIDAAFLSGWKLGFGGDHHIQSLSLAAGVNANGTTANIVASASMYDSSGNDATTAQIDAGLLAASTTEDGVYAGAVVNQETTDTVGVDLGVELSDAVVLLQDYQVRFSSGDHHVKTIGGGCPQWAVEGSQVRLSQPRAFLTDNSGNNESGGSSSVSLLVVGVPKATSAS